MAAVMQLPKPPIQDRTIVPAIRPLRATGLVELPETGQLVATGWLPDIPDLRDFTDEHQEILKMVENLGITKPRRRRLPCL